MGFKCSICNVDFIPYDKENVYKLFEVSYTTKSGVTIKTTMKLVTCQLHPFEFSIRKVSKLFE